MRILHGRRWPALLVLVVLLGALVVLSGQRTPRKAASFGSAPVGAMPLGAAPEARSSTWFCAAGSAAGGGPIDLSVVLANAADVPRAARITWFRAGGLPVVQEVEVAPSSSTVLPATAVFKAPTASALVEIDGGGVGVEHAINGPSGSAIAPCATEASESWYFANGVTERDARMSLAIFNPFPADAVVDLSFSTESGQVAPPAGQGIPVPASSTVYVSAQDLVRRRAIAAVAITARAGAVVVDRVQLFDGSTGRRGVGLAAGAPRAALRWDFPDGLSRPPAVSESWHVYNPSDVDAEITLSLGTEKGDPPAPLDLTVPARSQLKVSAEDTKVDPDVAHSVTIQSQNGVAVVAERMVDLRAPSARVGWSSSFGASQSARSWLFPAGDAGGRTDEWLIVRNTSPRPVSVSVAALAQGVDLAIEGLQELEVAPGGRLALRLGDHIQRAPLPLFVRATGPVVVERALYGVGRTFVSTAIGIPFP
jgi:hypothetical protein